MMTKLTANDGHAESELHAEAWAGDVDGVARVLDSGFDVNWQDSIGETALFGAVAWAENAVVVLLLARGAQVSVQNNEGWSPLHWAASHGGVDMIDLLVAHGADAHLADHAGAKAIDIARRYGKGDRVARLKMLMGKRSRS
ncbi:MAG: ankyrin repeat domain-containing protein [Xanthomonadales bacterium]|nr:ankyrin repeat domain-containing protein [Xanthomonadales bacterium]MCB1636975.1 ankyrin repeat domain-containing protein [Xanthomonadales bacterium]